MAVDRTGRTPTGGTLLTHSERLAETRRLLNAAATTQDPDQRRSALTEVAALHADDALALVRTLYRRRQPDSADQQESESALLAYALEAYVDAVLALDPTTEGDVLPQVLPAVRDAVVRFSRQQVTADAGPGVGVRSRLR